MFRKVGGTPTLAIAAALICWLLCVPGLAAYAQSQDANPLMPPGSHFVPYLLVVISALLSILGLFSWRFMRRIDWTIERVERHELTLERHDQKIDRNSHDISELKLMLERAATAQKEWHQQLSQSVTQLTRDVDRYIAAAKKD